MDRSRLTGLPAAQNGRQDHDPFVRAERDDLLEDLPGGLARDLVAAIGAMRDADEDRVHVFVLCAACAAKTEVLGTAELVRDREFYVI